MGEEMVETVEGRLFVPYRNWYGTKASRFFLELRDRKRLLATRCSRCDKVLMPPRSVCPDCFQELGDWVELPPRGTLITYTTVHYDYSDYYQPKKAPYSLGIVRLDGAHTGMCHFLGEVDPEEIHVGMRVEAVFRETREGNILDIAYFKPIEHGINQEASHKDGHGG